MIEVRLEEGDKIDWALKTFKKKVMKSGILKELRLERSTTMRSVTNGSGTKDESRNAERSTPTPPSAGSVAFTQGVT